MSHSRCFQALSKAVVFTTLISPWFLMPWTVKNQKAYAQPETLSATLTDDKLQPLVNSKSYLEGFGNIAYRAPVPNTKGPVVVLIHGIYGGASHRAFYELAPLLDEMGYRVYLADLPGAGASDKQRKEYSLDVIDAFVERFLDGVVMQKSVLVAESVSSMSALTVAKKRPDLVEKVVMLSPTGIKTLSEGPTENEQRLFETLSKNDTASKYFYRSLLSDLSVQFFVRRAYHNDSAIPDYRYEESKLALQDLDSRYLALSFVGGQIFRAFEDAAEGVKTPTLAIFGAEAESPSFNGQVEHPADFEALRPDFKYEVVAEAGQSMQREKPADVAKLIKGFVESN